METKQKSDIDEIIFENRNKNYGAYFLRKAYDKFVTRALLISAAAIFLAAIIPFIAFKQARSVNLDKSVGVEFANLDAPKNEDAPPPPPPPPPAAIEQRVRFTPPIVTIDTVEDSGMLNQDDLNRKSTNTTPVLIEDPGILVDEHPIHVIEQPAPILLIVEVMPTFVGDEEGLYKYLHDNIHYPQVAKETNIAGKCVVTFVVEKDGSITDVVLLKDIGGGCGDEALRVVKGMPHWNPGKQNGTPARVQFQLPIQFTLN
jgi:periplasmic protein TonB